MPTECVFTLPTGLKCRCMATRGHAFCRHHGAPARPRRSRADDRWNRLSCWRSFTSEIHTMVPEEIPGAILNLLQALLDNVVSDRFAGRSLRLLLQRCGELPLAVAPEFQPTSAPLPPALQIPPRPAHRQSPEPSRDRILQSLLSLSAELSRSQQPVVRSEPSAHHAQPSAHHPRPSAPVFTAVR